MSVDVGPVHVLVAPGGPCSSECPHPDHQPVCDHCGARCRLEYRPNTNTVRWTHDTGPVGRWTCEGGAGRMATVAGLEWFNDTRDLVGWRNEALQVLDAWEQVWEQLGRPGRLGSPKSQGVLDQVRRLRNEVAVWMNGVADVVEPLGYDREAACGPSDLLPGLLELAERARSNLLEVDGVAWCTTHGGIIDETSDRVDELGEPFCDMAAGSDAVDLVCEMVPLYTLTGDSSKAVSS